jgi:hypothetical protein
MADRFLMIRAPLANAFSAVGYVNGFTAGAGKIGHGACFQLQTMVRSVLLLPEGGPCFCLVYFRRLY